MKLEEVIHLYLGCEVEYNLGTHGKLTGKLIDMIDGQPLWFKPILRPLSDMTEEEAVELTKPVVVYGSIPNARKYVTYKNSFGRIVVSWGESHHEKYVPETEAAFLSIQFSYLLKQGFDLFGLIESGQAINSTPLTQSKQRK